MAEFLGYSYHHKHNQVYFAGWNKGKLEEYLCRTHQQLKFHNDWNWLMQVVEKIEEISSVRIQESYCDILNKNTEYYIEIVNQPTKIQAVYLACLQFIQNESSN